MLPDIFSRSYPVNTSAAQKAGLVVGISLFVFAFLFLFAPFGLVRLDTTYRFFVCLGYGLACALAMAVNYYLVQPSFPTFFDESKWTIGRQIVWIVWILFTISIVNTIYSAWIEVFPFSFSQLLIYLSYVFLVGIFPISAIVFIDYLRLYRKHAKKAELLHSKLSSHSNANKERLTLISDNENERLQLEQEELLYLTSADNYVEIVYRLESGLQKNLLRGTLKGFEQQLQQPGSDIIRCHRSYIVNLSQIINISGNAQGYSLQLRGTDTSIPVSRSYAKKILSALE